MSGRYDTIQVGDRVHHEQHGDGVVTWVYRSGHGVLVRFDAEPDETPPRNVPERELTHLA